jgi:hypothetical protein
MPPVKPLDRISNKWANVVSVSQDEYQAGVQNPRKDWQQATAAAEANYEKGVQAAIQRKAFGRGVKNVPSSNWQQAALEKGTTRWTEGVRLSQNKYQEGFAPYRQVIEQTSLPPRGPKGDPNNIRRVEVLAKALHAKKQSMTGSS